MKQSSLSPSKINTKTHHSYINTMKLKFKKIFSTAKIPAYTKKGDAGMDLTAISLKKEDDYWEYGTGLSVEIPEGHAGLLFPRSSISNKDQYLRNSVGVIDSGYRGEIKLRMSVPPLFFANYYEVGERVGQLVIIKLPSFEIEEVNELSGTERADGGFGSTGN